MRKAKAKGRNSTKCSQVRQEYASHSEGLDEGWGLWILLVHEIRLTIRGRRLFCKARVIEGIRMMMI
jgi:hypothetical protein